VELILSCVSGAAAGGVEVVERKGLGHPDTICDALAERLSLSLSRFYLERFGAIHHHNVDKALLWSGVTRPRFGGGEVVEPLEIFLAGRATLAVEGVRVPVEELAVEGSRAWLREHLHAFDADAHAVIRPLVRPGSPDLVELYGRGWKSGIWLANDTSCGAGWAPLDELESVVQRVERVLSAAARERRRGEVGEDVKVLGVRRDGGIRLTLGCAFVDRFLADADAYLEAKRAVAHLARETACAVTRRDVAVEVNAADDPAAGSFFLTVTGTSAEGGDDGGAGRGNRVCGLIAPGRPMTLESAAGKNPVTHVGKLYNLLAPLIAEALVEELPEVAEARCLLVSRIGQPVSEPQVADVWLRCREATPAEALEGRVRAVVHDHLARAGGLWEELLAGRLALDRWPLRAPGRGVR
jgi:S-adenosylmethionine synthetase